MFPDAQFITAAADAPALPGAYVLVIALDQPLIVTVPAHARHVLPAGRYLYCGSARGPGGLRARLSRHMRSPKSIHWHVDRLTEAGRIDGAFVFPDGDECALVARLSHLQAPIAGFGSTDCKRCRSHLLAWPREDDS
jgi:histidyl-tRNA synthetase